MLIWNPLRVNLGLFVHILVLWIVTVRYAINVGRHVLIINDLFHNEIEHVLKLIDLNIIIWFIIRSLRLCHD